VEKSPLPADLDDRLSAQLTFLIEVDQLKTVLRQSPLAAADRRENDAEHSWHLAMMVAILAEYSDEPIDVGRTIQLVLLHDLVEIYAGDTPLYDGAAGPDQHEREAAAAVAVDPWPWRNWLRECGAPRTPPRALGGAELGRSEAGRRHRPGRDRRSLLGAVGSRAAPCRRGGDARLVQAWDILRMAFSTEVCLVRFSRAGS
jgi:hypothetical protein